MLLVTQLLLRATLLMPLVMLLLLRPMLLLLRAMLLLTLQALSLIVPTTQLMLPPKQLILLPRLSTPPPTKVGWFRFGPWRTGFEQVPRELPTRVGSSRALRGLKALSPRGGRG